MLNVEHNEDDFGIENKTIQLRWKATTVLCIDALWPVFFLDAFRQLCKIKINKWSTMENDRNNEGTEYRTHIPKLMNAISIIVEKQIKTENRLEHRSTKNNK